LLVSSGPVAVQTVTARQPARARPSTPARARSSVRGCGGRRSSGRSLTICWLRSRTKIRATRNGPRARAVTREYRRGRYWDRTSDLFGVNAVHPNALTSTNTKQAGQGTSVQRRWHPFIAGERRW